jgi:hypothetical protein
VPTRSILTLCAAAIAAVMLGACGGSTSVTAAPTATTVKNTARECGPSEENCTPARVIATVTRLYAVGAGATRTEAACLAQVFGKYAHAVNQAFDAPTEAQTRAAIACVGTEARARVLATALAKWFGAHPSGT